MSAAPPSYEQATADSPLPPFQRIERNGIPPNARRSMEDELRELPPGWVRTYDPETNHQFFVDTRADPAPRSIWHHPYDDDEYMKSLPAEERTRIKGLVRHPMQEDITAETTDDEEGEGTHHQNLSLGHGKPQQKHKQTGFGRRLKDKLTGSTHEQRLAARQQREKQERDLYRQHLLFRTGLQKAIQTGQPQLLGKDDNGSDVYLEPPGSRYPGVKSVRRINSQMQEVFYGEGAAVPVGARHIRPDGFYDVGLMHGRSVGRPYQTYQRPYGNGYGGGIGMFPVAAPLIGGMMLGGLLF
ncbi:uncharacterized protein BCR38DRAFT_331317 [Pseudomassariella vexata]|uniref:WW domain-containing protein n=1 Tax=Pseudomassariella vexata TaxID=1141098 RepID=A0A1Y2EHR5_9PEZI|nr:uncharacterized protein BCR38DRAFT_331317 [Pseudomassariella vexata]ORY70967.1 hypothetical protein BCR38DRAFT_331317 [Pseudomassariella vexata]